MLVVLDWGLVLVVLDWGLQQSLQITFHLSILIQVQLWTAVNNPHLSLAEIKRVGVGQRTVRAAVTATKLRRSIFSLRNSHKYLCLMKDESLGKS